MADNIWYNDPEALIKYPGEIFPLNYGKLKTNERKINSITRTIIYGSLLVLLLGTMKIFIRVMMIAIIAIIAIIVYYEIKKSNESNEGFIDKQCVHPPITYDSYYSSIPTAPVREKQASALEIVEPVQINDTNNMDHIIYDIKNHMGVHVEPSHEFDYLNHQLHRNDLKIKLMNGNKLASGMTYGSQMKERHIADIRDIYNRPY